MIMAIPALMYQLFYNLEDNALKFPEEDLPSVVRIEARGALGELGDDLPGLKPGARFLEIVVSGNGIGFNPGYAERCSLWVPDPTTASSTSAPAWD